MMNRRDFLKIMATAAAAQVIPAYAQNVLENESFDYIIIGSGAGGGVTAYRLAEAGYSVLVIEAGTKNRSLIGETPGLHLSSSVDPEVNWNFYVQHYSDREKHGRRYTPDKGMLYPRASALGGCTEHHVMLMMSPAAEEWNEMADLVKDDSWSSPFMSKALQNVKCWLPLEKPNPIPLLNDFPLSGFATSAVLGNLSTPDVDPMSDENINHPSEGVFLPPLSIKDGKRFGTRNLLLLGQQRFPSLKILTESFVTKINFEPGSKPLKAVGVNVTQGSMLYQATQKSSPGTIGKKYYFKAKKEVVIAGGAFNSPQILMLSGIGNEEQLRKNGIKTLLDLPGVGENLQDRVEASVVYEFKNDFSIINHCKVGELDDPCLTDYLKHKNTHPYSSNGVLLGIKRKSDPKLSRPDLFIFATPSHFEGYKPGFGKTTLEKSNRITWAILKAYTSSQGTVKIKSDNPFAMPEINFRDFGDGNPQHPDATALAKGIQLARETQAKLQNFRWLDGNSSKEIYPGNTVMTDAELRDFSIKECWGHHASCSNKMGTAKDSMAVLDSKLKVNGTSNLRVIDASSFPKIPGFYITMAIYMLAEKASKDIISKARGLK